MLSVSHPQEFGKFKLLGSLNYILFKILTPDKA